MAKLTKYLMTILLVVVVVAGAVAAAVTFELLAGAVVLLAAVVVTVVVMRFHASRQEKAGTADWSEVLGETSVTGEALDTWSPSPARSGRLVSDPSVFALRPDADTTDAFETLPETTGELTPGATEDLEAFAEPGGPTSEAAPADDVASGVWAMEGDGAIDWSVPAEWGQGPVTDDASDDDGFAADVVELTFPGDEPPADDDEHDDEPPDETDPVGLGEDPVRPDDWSDHREPPEEIATLPPVEVRELAAAESFSYAGVSGNGNGMVDWSGPVHTVEEHVHTADDILEASAATALPTVDDRPAPAAGSELARLLAKVEARLRDYE